MSDTTNPLHVNMTEITQEFSVAEYGNNPFIITGIVPSKYSIAPSPLWGNVYTEEDGTKKKLVVEILDDSQVSELDIIVKGNTRDICVSFEQE